MTRTCGGRMSALPRRAALVPCLLAAAVAGCAPKAATLASMTPAALPRTADADAFAIAFLDQMQALSLPSGREYCGVFGRAADGTVRATAPVRGERDSCTATFEPDAFRTFAVYHSQGAFDSTVDAEVPSAYDVVADREQNVTGYVSTPGGRVWRSDAGTARLVCGPGCIAADPAYRADLHPPIADAYTADALRLRARATRN